MSLTEAYPEKKLRIVEIRSGREARRKLNAMGLHIDDFIIKLNSSKNGPVLLKNAFQDSQILAIGHNLAQKIFVEYE